MTQLLLLKSFLYRCLSDLTLRPQFKRDCHTSLEIAELYIITVTKMLRQTQYTYMDSLFLNGSRVPLLCIPLCIWNRSTTLCHIQ